MLLLLLLLLLLRRRRRCSHQGRHKVHLASATDLPGNAPCGLRGCKNGPAPFPDRMSYKATKPGLVCLIGGSKGGGGNPAMPPPCVLSMGLGPPSRHRFYMG